MDARRNLSETWFLIWEAILMALVVASVESFVAGHELTWTALTLPTGVLIPAWALLARGEPLGFSSKPTL
jgi:hypothetical protein